jgi:DNA helicase-2/ATP-dependent DNA helicase PcrA
MQLPENRVIWACAGSGKTTRLVDEALENRSRRIAFVTYTNNNARQIVAKFQERNSGVPRNVEVMTWFTFLLRQCVRPYQNAKYSGKRIDSIFFVNKQSARFAPETHTERHYFSKGGLLYSDKASRFVVECERKSNGAMTNRLSQLYTDLFIDEFQDLCGWDLNFIVMLLKSRMRVTLVGDPRQHIYSTNPSRKNHQYQGIGMIDLLNRWTKSGYSSLEFMNTTHRCNSGICTFANALWRDIDPMSPANRVPNETGHDGVFLVDQQFVPEYLARFAPAVLQHSKVANAADDALNFGMAKGLEFPRVLIVPTKPIRDYLRSGDVSYIQQSRDRLHVAVTRARHSVAFVYAGASSVIASRWLP